MHELCIDFTQDQVTKCVNLETGGGGEVLEEIDLKNWTQLSFGVLELNMFQVVLDCICHVSIQFKSCDLTGWPEPDDSSPRPHSV